MAKVTIHDPTRSASAMAAEDAVAVKAPVPEGWDEFRSADGRIVVHAARRLSVLDRMHFYRAISSDRQSNPLWMQLASAVASIRRVNGDPVPIPEGEREIEALIGRVGDDVIDQVSGAQIVRMTAEFAQIEARAKN